MLQYMSHFEMDSDASERIVRRAVAYDVPVQVHISTSNARAQPSSFGREQMLDLFAIAERVPEAQYVLAHAVGNQAGNPPVVDEYLDLVEECYGAWPDNFWMEIADFSSPGLRSALSCVPADRLISGTDWTTRVGPPFLPFGSLFGIRSADENPFPPSVQELVGFLKRDGATDATIARVAYRNAAELLGITIE